MLLMPFLHDPNQSELMWSKVFVCASLRKSTPIPAELMNADNVEMQLNADNVEMQLHSPMTPDSEVNRGMDSVVRRRCSVNNKLKQAEQKQLTTYNTQTQACAKTRAQLWSWVQHCASQRLQFMVAVDISLKH